ncbi:unnamed protein product, partial [Ectocarpus sp. 12 AP-2014]
IYDGTFPCFADLPKNQDVMRQAGCEMLDAILLTHWHADHVGGV